MTLRSLVWCVAAIVLAVSCGHPSITPPPLVPVRVAAAPHDACVLIDDSPAPPPTLDIAVPDVASFVQRQVYETLIRLDCTGAALPALAQSWSSEEGGRRWILTLRPGARYSDSVPLTAADVFAALTRDSSLLAHGAVTLESFDRVSVGFAAAFAGAIKLGQKGLVTPWYV